MQSHKSHKNVFDDNLKILPFFHKKLYYLFYFNYTESSKNSSRTCKQVLEGADVGIL